MTKSLLANEVFQDFFTFKVFLPLYPPMRKRLLEDDAYGDMKWDTSLMTKTDRAQQDEVGEILYQFKKANFKKEQSEKVIKKKTADFDENWDYIN